MKVIVISWMYPQESNNNCDDRPKSIERICSSIDSVKEYMTVSSACFGKYLEWADSLFSMQCRDKGEKYHDDQIEEFYGCNGYEYLESCLKHDELGKCVARMYYSEEDKLEDAHYFIFQVRNLH